MTASPTIIQAEDAIRTIVQTFVTAPAWPVIWGNQNAPRPTSEKYIELLRLNWNRVGREFVGNVNSTTGNAPTLGTREFTISFNAFGPGNEQILEDVRTFLDTDAVTEALHSAGLTVIDSGEILNLAKLYGQQFKGRSQLDVFFRAHAYSADGEKDLGYINEVDLELKTVDQAGQESVENLIIETE